MKQVEADLKTYLANHRNGMPGEATIGQQKRDTLNGLIGTGTAVQRAANPLYAELNPKGSIRTWRIDRLNDAQPSGRTGYFFDYDKINNNRMPQQIPREAQGMPDAVDALTTDQLQRQYEENQGYLGLSTLGMREGRPVRGGAAQTRELLRRNEAISAELERRGVREEDPQLQRALQRRGQAMPDAAAQNLEQSAVESFQWMRNKEGGQAYGNQQVTVPLTEQIFQQEMKPRMQDGYAASLAEYQAKHPEVTHASFVKVAGEGPWKFNGDGTVDSLRPNPPNRGWAMPVDSFKSKAAKVQGKTADSEAFPAPRGQAMPDAVSADAPPFYMKSAQVLDSKIQGKAATVDQVRAILTNPQNGIKAEELKWTGALQAAERLAKENNGRVPKDALLQYLADDGAVRLEEVTMSELGKPEARYSPYQLDGGRNYREVILTMPDPLDSKRYARMNEIEATLSSVKSVSQEEIARLRDEYRNLSDAASNYRGYTSSHFNTPNYVAHMRLNERVDASGRPGLFLEEIQSDRHQEGREKGYQDNDPKDTTGWTVEIKQNPAFPNTRVAEVRDSEGVQIDFQYNVPDNFTESEAIRLAASKAVPYKIPDAPFRKDWPLQMFKRALSDAVLGGKEWIGWTTGETQAARYDKQLADNLDTIEVRKDEDGQSFYVLGYKNKREVIDSGAVSQNKLSDLIGKDMAAKAIESKDGEVTFSGKDLTIGGKGMEGFYDQILPKEISKYVKQWDGKVEKVKIGLQNALEELRFNLFNPENRAVTAFLTMEEAQAAAKKAGKGYTVRETPLKNPTPIWRVNITPQMRESIKKAGQALFVGGSAAVVAEEELR
jgi:hypothetical protein